MSDLPVISISDAEVTVSTGTAQSQQRNLEFTVQLSAPVAGNVSFDYRTVSGTGEAHRDFVASSGALTIPGGSTTGTIVVRAWGNGEEQPDKDFSLLLSNLEGAVFEGGGLTAQAQGVILDPYESDTRPSLFVSDPLLVEGNSGTREALFEVRLSRPFDQELILSYRTEDGSATAGDDYTARTGTLTFAPGQTHASVAVPVVGDTLAEPTEHFSLVVEPNPSLANGAEGLVGVATILDDDSGGGSLPVLSVLDAEVTVSTGTAQSQQRNLEFTVQLSAPVAGDVSFDYRTVSGTGEAHRDFVASSGTLTIPGGSTTGTIVVRAWGNGEEQPDKDFSLLLSNLNGAAFEGGELTAQAQGVILDPYESDTRPSLFVSDPLLVEGNSGTREALFEVRLSRPTEEAIELQYSTLGLGATSGVDFTPGTGTLIFAPGQTRASVMVPVSGDTHIEPTEQLGLVITGGHQALGWGSGGVAGTATLLDDDAGGGSLPVLSVLDAEVTVSTGTAQSQQRNLEFTVHLSAPASGDVTMDYTTVGGTAVPSEDFVATSGTFTIPSGNTSGTIFARAWGNGERQPDKDFTLELSNISGAAFEGGGQTVTATGTIRDPFPEPTSGLPALQVDNIEANLPDETVEFTVSLPVPAALNVSGSYELLPGTLPEGAGFDSVSGTFTIPSGATSVSIPVPSGGLQNSGTVILRLSDVTNARLPNSSDDAYAIATLQVTGAPEPEPNAPPEANDDSYAVRANQGLNVSAALGVLANDSDPDGDPLSVVSFDPAANGTLEMAEDGSFSYTPDSGFVGSETLSYTVSDGVDSAQATVTIEVTNQAPVAVDDSYATGFGEVLSVDAAAGLLANDSDPDGDPLSVLDVEPSSLGTLEVQDDGSFTFTPDAGASGSETLAYTLSDGIETTQGEVTLEVASGEMVPEGQEVQAMYLAYYGRPADPAGIDYWGGLLEQAGGDPRSISQAFGDSQEFIDNYGGLSDQELVSGLYQQLFDRDPDSEGLDFYVNELQSGAMSLADIALAIAKGAQGGDALAWQAKLAAADAFTQGLGETLGGQQAYAGDVSDIKAFIAGITGMGSFTQGQVEALIEATVSEAAMAYAEDIQTLFVAYYGRPGDPDGLGFWAQQALASDGDLSSIVQAFGNSEEYTQTLGGLSEEDQVGVIFQQLFGRDPDDEGLDFYVGHLEAGNLTLADIALTVATGAQGNDADVLAARVGFAKAYTNTLNAQEKLEEFASPQGQAAVKAAMARIFDEQDAEEALNDFLGDSTIIVLDILESTEAMPFRFDAEGDSFLFFDDVIQPSHTEIENFSADDAIQLQGVTDDDVGISVQGQDTHIEFDDGQGTLSKIVLLGVGGSHSSVDEFSAADHGEINFA